MVNNHTTEIIKKLFDLQDELVLIFDGTYVEHQKSRNNDYQRRSYNMHKHCNLAKPFTVYTLDGFVLDVPFYAGFKNDTNILKDILDNNTDFNNLLREGDVFIIDRGFRDVVDNVRKREHKYLMPALKGKRNFQQSKQMEVVS